LASAAVLDASAILAVVFSEPGSDAVLPLLQGGLLSTVNLAEVHTRLLLRGASADFAWRRVLDLGFEVCFFDDRQARLAAELIGQTRPYGLSLGDRACLALAIERKAAAYTTDAAWKKLNLGISVEVIR
jgi:PIN domain nuclease of toxin-antitoxin system